MPKIEFVGSSARDQTNVKGNPSRLVNGYREPMIPGGKGGFVLRGVMGMDEFVTLPGVFMRDMVPFSGAIYATCGGKLYRVTSAGDVTEAGTVIDDPNTTSAENNGTLSIVANSVYVTTTGASVSAPIATGAVANAGSVAYLGGYTLVSEKGGRIVQWSGLVNPATFNGTHFASAEITPDPIIRILAFKDALYVFKAAGFERWGITGAAGANAFARIDGAFVEPGLAGFNLITIFPNGFAFVGSDGKVHVFVGGGLQPISTPPVEVALTENTPERMFYYERRGHGFICLIFADAMAWCYDIATGEWHERGEDGEAWTARAAVRLGSEWYVGTDAGKIARLTPVCRDFGRPLVRRYVSRTLDQSERFSVAKIEAFPRVGLDVQGLGDTSEAEVVLRTSRDGFTWSEPKPRPVGETGGFRKRVVWRSLGQFREATLELSLSCEADLPLLAEVDVEIA